MLIVIILGSEAVGHFNWFFLSYKFWSENLFNKNFGDFCGGPEANTGCSW